MADLKTTQDRRERFVTWLHMPGEDRYSVRAWATAEDACDDVEVLLRENAKLLAEVERLRGVESAARDVLTIHLNDAGPEAFRTMAALRGALGEP